MTIQLTKQELYDVTHKKRYRSQADALNKMGIDFKIRPDGSILVSRAAYEASMRSQPTSKKVEAKPNFSSMKNVT